MQLLPKRAKRVEIKNSTVDFYEFEENFISYYYFDTSECQVPEPMINAMLGLKLIANTDKKLIMINHCIPNGLFPKIDKAFNFEIEEFDDKFKIIFSYKKESREEINYKDNQCLG